MDNGDLVDEDIFLVKFQFALRSLLYLADVLE